MEKQKSKKKYILPDFTYIRSAVPTIDDKTICDYCVTNK